MKASAAGYAHSHASNVLTPRLECLIPESPLVLVLIMVSIELQAVCRMYLVVELALTYFIPMAMYIIDCICASY